MLDPVNELEEVTVKNPVIMGNPTSIQINTMEKGLGITVIGGIDTPTVNMVFDLVQNLEISTSILVSYYGPLRTM